MKPGQWCERQKSKGVIRQQTEALADLLEEAGEKARLDTKMTFLTSVTDIRTDHVAFRPSMFLPEIAARDRRPMLNALGYYLEEIHEEPAHVRYGVVTGGDLVPAMKKGELRRAMQRMSRKISKIAHEADREWDVEFLFRGGEFTRSTARERHEYSGMLADVAHATPDLVLYHPHQNFLYRPRSKMSGERWKEFLLWMGEKFGTHWKDNGPIRNLREIVKYVCKPGDLLEGDKPIEALEAKWLFEELFKLRQMAPLGCFKDWWKELREGDLKIVRRNSGNLSELVVVHKSKRLDHSGNEDDPIMQDNPEQTEENRDETKMEYVGEAENIFLGVTLPQHSATPWAEPVLLIHNYNPQPVSQSSLDRLQEIRHEQVYWKEQWMKKGAPSPETALCIAREWERAGATSNVMVLSSAVERLEDRTEALLAADAERRSFRVHKSRVNVRDHRSSTRRVPPDPPPEKVPVIHLREGDDIIKAVEEVLGTKKSDANARVAPVIDIWG
ncbi:MAG: hypothetical protein ABJL55_17130 [Roseibium sp.]